MKAYGVLHTGEKTWRHMPHGPHCKVCLGLEERELYEAKVASPLMKKPLKKRGKKRARQQAQQEIREALK